MFKKLLALSTLVILTACTGSSTTSNGGNNQVSQSQMGVVIDPMTSVPVMNGSSTQGTLYIHNYGTKPVSGLHYSLDKSTVTSQVKSLLSRAGLKISGGLEDSNGFVLQNPERCSSIGANSSCSINFTTPSLSFANQGSALVTIDYINQLSKATSTSQVINYNYVDGKNTQGINFTGSLEVNGAVGSTRYVVGYIYAGGAVGSLYKGVNLTSSNPSTRISGGFINNQEVATNQVIAVEFGVAIQNDHDSHVNVVPSWNSASTNLSATSVGNGVPLGISIVPGQGVVNYLFGNIPILVVGVNTSGTINVINNGDSDSANVLTVEQAGEHADDLSVDMSDCLKVLESNAGNSCSITYNLSSETSGSTTLIYKDSQDNEVGRQDVYWLGNDNVPVVKVTRSTESLFFEQGNTSNVVTFTLQNIGTATLESLTYPVTVTGASSWTQVSTDCGESLAPQASCNLSGTLSGAISSSGVVYIKAMGSYADTSYSFISLPINYAVGTYPELSISPAGTQTLEPVIASGSSAKSITYTLSNASGAPTATITSIDLVTAVPKSYNPTVSGGTCSIGSTVDFDNDCTVIVTFGPVPTSESQSFNDGYTQLSIGYSGGDPVSVPGTISSGNLNYSLQGNDSSLGLVVSASNMTGNGQESNPYYGTANGNNMEVVLTYTNLSSYFAMANLNFDTNSLPYGVSASGDCSTGSAIRSLSPNGTCTLRLSIDKSLLKTSSQGGSVVLDLTTPTATWSVDDMGLYTQTGQMVYINYLQPSVTFNLSNNNGGFESTVLTMVLANESAGSTPVVVDVSQVKAWLVESPVDISNCTIDNSDYSAACNLGGVTGESAQVAYIMPSYLNPGESAYIPLVYSTTNEVYLASAYDFINYVAPKLLVIFVTQNTYNGNLGGGSGADTICNNDPGKPSEPVNAQYKALLMFKDGSSNNATQVGLSYYRTDGTTLIAVATGGFLIGFGDKLEHSISTQPLSVWSGGFDEDSYTCNDWTSSSNAGSSWQDRGDIGRASSTTSTWRASAFAQCSDAVYLYCVQQP